MNYSDDFKKQVIVFCQNHKICEAVRHFGVSRVTIYKWIDPLYAKRYKKQYLKAKRKRMGNSSYREKINKKARDYHDRQKIKFDYRKRKTESSKKSWHKRKSEDPTFLDKVRERWKVREIERRKDTRYLEKCHASGRKCNRKRRAWKAQVQEQYNILDEQYTKELFPRCVNCNSNKDLCIDHLRPLSKGFALSRKNAIVLCMKCNSSKGNKMPEDFFSSDKLMYIKGILENQ